MFDQVNVLDTVVKGCTSEYGGFQSMGQQRLACVSLVPGQRLACVSLVPGWLMMMTAVAKSVLLLNSR